ncbi:DeoR/GlpR family DNA-binding transcription regulator [Propionicimonas sp.]|uniref:DeoR/GlpR family DNA-binding transcription regulator n=1 Tax=Propionicimonas sp. TaxID=1955623 RepID=UPI0039E3E43B
MQSDDATPAAAGRGAGVEAVHRPRRDLKGDHRRGRIIELLSPDGADSVTVGGLADSFGVSEATIRRDLAHLEDRGLITRTYGGAAISRPRAELSMPQRESTHARAKRSIGRAAAGIVEDGDLVILDAGSTTEQVAAAIGNRPVSVVTNGLRVINRLLPFEHTSVLVLGGALRGFNETISGPDAETMLSRVYARFAFIGGDGVHPQRGVASRTYEQSRIKSLMMERAADVFVVADSSKLTDESFPYWSALPQEWGLITDRGADRAALAALRLAGATDIITTEPE